MKKINIEIHLCKYLNTFFIQFFHLFHSDKIWNYKIYIFLKLVNSENPF